ncbi:hypothetical protein HA052_15165 [Chromobacterium haemolyticum]|uniref:Uncharacterized protein n=1 Tax=Chromobacterium fluminis TaxID=3044269 RepID=A0ABX0LAA3_9NEIS|nr:hypothetical protein [Chromobacterium haemolyticum]NHR06531.1 hypothetical protein [Chromobacterium haemolyticum]
MSAALREALHGEYRVEMLTHQQSRSLSGFRLFPRWLAQRPTRSKPADAATVF